jgi:hypothetical protein
VGVDHPFFTVVLHEPVRFSSACSLRSSDLLDQFAGAAKWEGVTLEALRPRDAAFVGRLFAKLFLVTSTVSRFFVVHKTEYAREFVEAKIASLSLSLAVTVFVVPMSQEHLPVLGRKAGLTNRASKLRAWRLLRNS